MNRKNGFTLVELLAVIVILGLLISFSTIAVTNIKKTQDIQNAKNVISGILTDAKRYESDNQYADAGRSIKIKDLISKGYTDFDTKKYADLVKDNDKDKDKEKDKEIYVGICNNGKLYYKISGLNSDIYDADNYNDCGCDEQGVAGETGKGLCTE